MVEAGIDSSLIEQAYGSYVYGNNTYGGKFVVNPSGGLMSKGHPRALQVWPSAMNWLISGAETPACARCQGQRSLCDTIWDRVVQLL